mmetsp:Transcript_43318/g.133449  ORF Transcript_43318/g.133449 Transcript_43318/m.133449 type:complete len:367 (+) Transcript_43318:146-1246(+)
MAGRPPPNKPKQRRAEGTVGHMSAVGQVRCRDILLTRGQGCHLKRTVDTVAKLLDVCESPALLASDWYYVRRSPLDTEEAVCRAEDAGGSRELPRTRGHRPCDSSAACAVGRPMLTEGGRLALKRDPLSNSGLAPIIDESVHVLRRDSVLFLLDDENNVERIMIYSTRAGALGDEERKAEYRAQQPELREAGELLTEMWDGHHASGKMLQRQVGALPGQDIGQAMFQAGIKYDQTELGKTKPGAHLTEYSLYAATRTHENLIYSTAGVKVWSAISDAFAAVAPSASAVRERVVGQARRAWPLPYGVRPLDRLGLIYSIGGSDAYDSPEHADEDDVWTIALSVKCGGCIGRETTGCYCRGPARAAAQ